MVTVRDELCALFNKIKTPDAVADRALRDDKARQVMETIKDAVTKGEFGVSLYNADEVRGLLELFRDAGFYVTAVPTGGISSKHIIAWDPLYSRPRYYH